MPISFSPKHLQKKARGHNYTPCYLDIVKGIFAVSLVKLLNRLHVNVENEAMSLLFWKPEEFLYQHYPFM